MSILPKVNVYCDFWKLSGSGSWKGKEVEAEVLTVHLEKNKMRVRYEGHNGKAKTMDVSAQPFFDKYVINEKKYNE